MDTTLAMIIYASNGHESFSVYKGDDYTRHVSPEDAERVALLDAAMDEFGIAGIPHVGYTYKVNHVQVYRLADEPKVQP